MDWSLIVADLAPKIYHFFCFFYSAEEADDCVQECLLRLVQKVKEGEFNPEKASLTSYTYGIARFIRLEHHRKRKRFPTLDEEIESYSNEEDRCRVEARDEIRHLRVKIQELSVIEQEVLALMIDQELTLSEIGVILNLPLNTVKSHVHRAKQRLKVLLDNEQGERYVERR